MQGDIFTQGLQLMLYGMGTVVVFLTALVVATMAMSLFIGRYFPEAPPQPPSPPRASAPAGEDSRLIAAIGAAVERFRREHR